jgi:hypothetical protein
MTAPATGAAGAAGHGADLRRAERAVRRARSLWPGQVLCLQSALVLHAVLRARGVPAAVRIGVRRDGDEFLDEGCLV